MEVGLGPATVRLGPSSLRKRAQPPPNFWPMSIAAKTAGWIKMPLGTEVHLGTGDVVLDGVAVFGPCLLWPNGWMDEDATW